MKTFLMFLETKNQKTRVKPRPHMRGNLYAAHPFRDKLKDHIRDNWETMDAVELANSFNEKHGTSIKKTTIHRYKDMYAKELGVDRQVQMRPKHPASRKTWKKPKPVVHYAPDGTVLKKGDRRERLRQMLLKGILNN